MRVWVLRVRIAQTRPVLPSSVRPQSLHLHNSSSPFTFFLQLTWSCYINRNRHKSQISSDFVSLWSSMEEWTQSTNGFVVGRVWASKTLVMQCKKVVWVVKKNLDIESRMNWAAGFENVWRRRPSELVYVDEAGIDNPEVSYGYCEIGQRFHALKLGKRTSKELVGLQHSSRVTFAPMTFLGSCNRNSR